ncbi:CBS domain-containing protein [Microtetraspora sp. AC03309]|uniref:CBS domain-containing protein n=1 Tax=Microtetraspora sp. AC03309 TaxID=2779376 RepID=UPI001E5F26CC|nr:CBS domain-containing protein [Microtetraspora sp. AC03309]MCC5579374.1 CBS domain-containing protein [Microtetraspora sp. AC03309]
MSVETLTAEQIMTRVLVTVTVEESPLMAWELMRRAGVHHLPVVDDDCHVLGILTREDVAATWCGGGPDEHSRRQVGGLLGRRRLPKVGPGHPLSRITGVMLDVGCDAVPVVSAAGTLLGLVTVSDVLSAVAGRTAREEKGRGEVRTGLFHLNPVLPPD